MEGLLSLNVASHLLRTSGDLSTGANLTAVKDTTCTKEWPSACQSHTLYAPNFTFLDETASFEKLTPLL